MDYVKPALTVTAQIDRLRARGLLIDDEAAARQCLSSIGYYRLSAYLLPFKSGATFQPGTTFSRVADLYAFDRRLRLTALDAIEWIEVAIRSAVAAEIAHGYGPFGHVNPAHFSPELDHARFMTALGLEERRAGELFAIHFRSKYTSEPHLPIWMATELVPFGTISMLYRAMRPAIRQRIASTYSVHSQFLATWLHALSYVRNVSAHHKRLWNRVLAVKPRFPTRDRRWPHVIPDNGRIYAMLVIMRRMLQAIAPDHEWRDSLFKLIDAYPDVPIDRMGFEANWRARAVWR